MQNKLSYIPKVEIIQIIDLTKYSEEGFLITPESLKGKYESVGPYIARFSLLLIEENTFQVTLPLNRKKTRNYC